MCHVWQDILFEVDYSLYIETTFTVSFHLLMDFAFFSRSRVTCIMLQ